MAKIQLPKESKHMEAISRRSYEKTGSVRIVERNEGILTYTPEEEREPIYTVGIPYERLTLLQDIVGILKGNEVHIREFMEFKDTDPLLKQISDLFEGDREPLPEIYRSVIIPCVALGYRKGKESVYKELGMVGRPEDGWEDWKREFSKLKEFVKELYKDNSNKSNR